MLYFSQELIDLYETSPLGLKLAEAFPFGTLHRGMFPQIAAWQEKYAPEVRRRTPKKRKRKRGRH